MQKSLSRRHFIKTSAIAGTGLSFISPVQPGAPVELIKSFRAEAKKSNILIAEVGAWSNTMDPNESNRKKAVKINIDALHLADEIGASCCVNISGARGEIWDGPFTGIDSPSRRTQTRTWFA